MKNIIIALLGIYVGFAQGAEAKQIPTPPAQLQSSAQTPNNQLDLSWADIENLSKILAEPLKKSKWAGILAITRGGMFPAGLLSQSLNIRRIEAISVQSYDGNKNRGEIRFLNMPSIENAGEKWLIVDDLVDSGKTMQAVKKLFPKAVCVTLFAKPEGLPMVDRVARVVGQNIWIIFPWEKSAAREQ